MSCQILPIQTLSALVSLFSFASHFQEQQRNLQDKSSAEQDAKQDGSSTTTPFKPIHIHFDTTLLDLSYFVKSIILPYMQDFWSSALAIVPVEANLLILTANLQGRVDDLNTIIN